MKALQPGLPTPAAFPKYRDKIIMNSKHIFYTISLHPDSYKWFAFRGLVILITNEAIYIIGKFFLKEWLIALYFVKKNVSTSIQVVRTFNLSLDIIH